MESRAFDPKSLPGLKSDFLAKATVARDVGGVAKLIGEGCEPERSKAHLAAAALGELETLRLLVDHGANLGACDADLRTAYELAHRHRQFAVVRFFQQFEIEDLVNEEGTPRWLCPYCWHWKFVGTPEDPCEHYLTSTDLFGTSYGFADFESSTEELDQRINDLEADGVDLKAKAQASKSDGARVVRDFLNQGDWLFWTQSKASFLRRVTVDLSETLLDTTYTDFYCREPGILAREVEEECKRALRWLEKLGS